MFPSHARNSFRGLIFLGLGVLACFAWAEEPLSLDQGLDAAARRRYHHQPVGSHILPYEWFLALEQPLATELFRGATHQAALGFMPDEKSLENPDGLPVGFTKETAADRSTWLGMNCAACHTSRFRVGRQLVQIDGGASLIDLIGWQQSLTDALRVTAAEPEKFQRFAGRVLGEKRSDDATVALRREVRRSIDQFLKWSANNHPSHPTGFGNWDAAHTLINTSTATATGLEDNYRVPQTPVSYSHLWGTSELDLLLWNASVPDLTLQNVAGTVAVFGRVDLKGPDGGLKFSSSVDMVGLQRCQEFVDQLQAPKWPESLLGGLNAKKIERGARIFEREACAKCHGNKAPYAKSEPNRFGRQFVKVTKVSIQEVGTDPTYATYFLQRTAQPGILAPLFHGTAFEGQPQVPAAILFLATMSQITESAIRSQPEPVDLPKWLNYRESLVLPKTAAEVDALIQSLLVYRAAPLSGTWATAPYLHNGSVPNLYELLLPPGRRSKTFRVGNLEFDSVRVGYQSTEAAGGSLFDTTIPGQSNSGHSYGTTISEEERWALIEYLKTL